LPPLISESFVGIAPLKNLNTIAGSIPAKVFDYMACEIPFIAFGGSDIKRIAENSGAGLVVANNPDALAEAILYLAENPLTAQEMGKKGRDYCEKYYNRKLMSTKIKSLIIECAQKSERATVSTKSRKVL
jgi:colanic acid biosynthesis glycosyl transferase WcaI